MRLLMMAGILIIGICLTGNVMVQAGQESNSKTWNFDSDVINAAPSGFTFGRTGDGRPGRWVILAEKDAPSGPNVLAQVDNDGTDSRFPIAVANEPTLSDLRLSARCKPVSGRVDQACGLVLRYHDENNYYVTRANVLEGNVRLYYVKDGRRHQIASWDGKVAKGIWHEFRIEARGDHLEIYWDDKKVIDAHDTTFQDAGKIGVWTKADSITYFDDFNVLQLGP